ncbi:MAG: pentapeptide repeat-containing protein [Alphaproteobacteria bacterium]
MIGPIFASATLHTADFTEATMQRAILDRSDMRGSSLRKAGLASASMIEADLRGPRPGPLPLHDTIGRN